MTPYVNLEPLASGIVLRSGRFRVLGSAKDGEGGMARVYVAEDRGAGNRYVALKEMRPRLETGGYGLDKQQEQFRNEAELLRRLSHPNIPSFVDSFDEYRRSFIAMEYVQGVTLHRHMHDCAAQGQGPGLPADQVIQWAMVLCNVLGYLHAIRPEKIIYRDLDPTNVMLEQEGYLKLIDFGIARRHKAFGSKDTIIMGKYGYVAPEIYEQQTDVHADIYSLGATMHALLTGNPSVPDWHGKPHPRPLRETARSVPEPLSDIVWQAMAKEPGDRFASTAAMASALERARQSIESSTATPSCRRCRARHKPGARFCPQCGTALGDELQAELRVCGHAMAVHVGRGECLIGRECQVQGIYPDLDLSTFDARFVSRRHALVIQDRNGFAVVDLGSRNGTRLNGQPIPQRGRLPLRSGDRIEVGSIDIEFRVVA